MSAFLIRFSALLALGFAFNASAAHLDPQLQHLMAFRDGHLPIDAKFAPRAARSDLAPLYLTFVREPSSREIVELEQRGVRFRRIKGYPAIPHVGRIYGVDAPWALIPSLISDPRLEAIDAAVRRHRAPAMDISMPEIGWSELRDMPQASTDGLSGRGVQIAAFDTSVDIYHPALLKPDGGLYRWLDADGDGVLTPGIDAVDLDQDGKVDADESLLLLENTFFDLRYGPQGDGHFDLEQDWLFADTNGDGIRNVGADEGYGETDLAFGEPLFIIDDVDADTVVDPGERLVRLGSSKVRAALDGTSSAVTHVRGSNLMTLATDEGPHGTSVAGIMLGDVAGRRYAGVAPEAELIEVYYQADGVDTISAIDWAKSQGADVMVYEFGYWSGEFLDGSSALEQAISSTAASGIPQVCVAGNIGENNKHGRLSVPAGGSAFASFYVDAQTYPITASYLTALWREAEATLSFSVAFVYDDGITQNEPVSVVAGSTQSNTSGDYVYGLNSTSSRNTRMLDLTLYHDEGQGAQVMNAGLYTVTVSNAGSTSATLHMYLADDQSIWSGGATWLDEGTADSGNAADPGYSVTSPATTDRCIVVGSYATRESERLGDLSSFSGRGPRIDGTSLLDVAAPGNYDVISPTSSGAIYFNQITLNVDTMPAGGSWLFSGTSASTPHVAGVAALLKQLDASLSHDEVEAAIRGGALQDSLTGDVPNEAWGMGKLRVGPALEEADTIAPTFTVLVNPHPLLDHYLQITVVPSERLATIPTVSSSTTSVPALSETGADLFTASIKAPASNSISLSVSGVDLSGNSATSTANYTW